MMSFTSDQWIIVALVFVLGLLIGGFLFAGGGRKWRHRYNAEVSRREELEREHRQRITEWEGREKEWRERDSLRGAALKGEGIAERDRDRDGLRDSRDPVIDRDRDGLDDRVEGSRKPGLMDRVLGRDADGDGVRDDRDPIDDRKL
jgi:hypothetical protein